ncbi:MAG: hypothetical protein P8P74_07560 [Crocinitomicaceae bacterium]|nr:hypothetical protein [Crocinitomicaceae bacterium]
MKTLLSALVIILLGLIPSHLHAQVSFIKGDVIKKSYASATMAVPPVLGKSNKGFFILSSGAMSAKKIIQLNLDQEMNQAGEEITLKLPKGKSVRHIFNIDNSMIVVLRGGKSPAPFEFYNYDAENARLGGLVLNVPVDEYPGREDLEITLLNQNFTEYLGFTIRPKIEYANVFRKVVMTSRKMDKIYWSKVLEDPDVPTQEATGDYALSDLYFNDASTLVARFTRPFLTEEKEQVQTMMYYFDGTSMRDAWYDDVIRSTSNEEFQSLPMPYINRKGKVEVYFLTCDMDGGSFDLVRGNYGGAEIERYPLSSQVEDLSEVKRIGVYGLVMPVNSHFDNGSFCFLISEQLRQFELTFPNSRATKKHYVVSFKRDQTGVSEHHVLDAGYIEGIWGQFDDKVILSNSLDVIMNGEIISTDESTVFDRYAQAAKKSAPGTTFHYVLNGELYSFHSECATGNMTSQLVKWNFN